MAQDHKAVGDGDTGPNTGGMGAYSPAAIFDARLQAQVMREIIEPTVRGLAAEGAPFTGVLFAGLMITENGPKTLNSMCGSATPECQVLDDAPEIRPAARWWPPPTACWSISTCAGATMRHWWW